MVNRLLTLQTLDTRVLEKIQLDVGHLLREIVRAWETRATQAGVKLRLEVSPDLPLLWAEYDLLSQVIVNLLDNAIKFSPNGGTVTARAYATAADQEHVAVGSQQPAVMVEVSDQGIGIPPEKLELLFRRFYQVDGSSTRQFGGMGIGLALCKAIVEAHGGRIWAESEGEGRGSTFYVALPAAGDGEME
jgi:histidine kinase